MQMTCCCGALGGLQRVTGFAHHRFKCFGPARNDLPIDQLPADAFLDKEAVDRVREQGSILHATVFVVPGEAGVKRLDDVVDLVPLAAIPQVASERRRSETHFRNCAIFTW
jgi:hypothetical protein